MQFRLAKSPLFVGMWLCCATVLAQSNYPPKFKDARVETYKTVGETELKLWLFESAPATKESQRPAIVFFFGGGWRAGSPAQFEKQCRYLASRGMVAITADYRVSTRHKTKADACVEDCKSAVRWIRKNAARLGIDPNQICAAGGSAGGHTACCTGVVQGFDASGEDLAVSSVPNALALFNPAVMIAPLEGVNLEIDDEKWADIASRTGVPPEQISPVHHVRKGLPPTIIFHGKADPTVLYSTVEEFERRMTAAGNRCELSGFSEAPHGFFNFRKTNNAQRRDRSDQWFRRTVFQLDHFLQSLGWLNEECSIHVVDDDFVSLRSNYLNSLKRFTVDKEAHVAFLGGSITEMDGYRPMICDWLQQRFPETKFTFTNAGISSTCSNTGAFRLQRDVLSKGPVDLLFVEFAVNDDQDAAHDPAGCVHGMEGVIRQVRKHNPRADMVMTHFVNPGMLETLAKGESIISASQHEKVARHYGVSSVYLSKALAARIADGRTTWKEFGGTHPKKPGNRLAADLATSVLAAAWIRPAAGFAAEEHELPETLVDRNSFVHGQLLSPEAAANQAWSFSEPDWKALPGSKRSRYLGRPMLHASTPDAQTEYSFNGTAIGVFITAGPDAGMVDVQVDDGDWKTIDLYHRYSKALHYPRTVMFANGLKPGPHTLKMKVSNKKNTASKGHAVRIIGFAVNGR